MKSKLWLWLTNNIKTGVTLNLDGSEDKIFIGYNKENYAEEMERSWSDC